MPSSVARYINNIKRQQENKKDKELKDKIEEELMEGLAEEFKSKKIDWKRKYNCYECKNHRKLKLIKSYASTDKKILEQNKGKAMKYRKKNYLFKCEDCEGCPYQKKCKHKRIIEVVSPVQFELINKFTLKRYKKIYDERFNKSESINGYFKSINGVYHLMGNNPTAIRNEVTLKSTLYNLIRLVNIKGTAY